MRLLLRFLPILALAACHAASPYEDDIVPDLKGADASVTCPADPAAAANTACTVEGASCSTCTDPCQFCNLLQCQGGKWQPAESFPSQCDGGTTD